MPSSAASFFLDNQGTDGRYADALGSFSDCLAGYKVAVHDKGDSLFCFSCLQISQDDVEFVHKLMVEGTQGIRVARVPDSSSDILSISVLSFRAMRTPFTESLLLWELP